MILGFLKINSFLTVICLFISNLTCCFSTVLSQATMIEIGSKMDKNEDEEIKEEKNQTNILITYNTIISNFGILIGSYLKGELIQLFNIRIVFIITSCLGLLPLISAIILKEFNDENDENISSVLNTSVKSNENEQTLIDYMFKKKIIVPFIIFLIVTTIPITFDTYFYYEIHYLNFKPVDFSKINVIYQVVTLIVIYLYDKLDCNTTKCSFFFIKFISTGSGFFFYLIYNEYYEQFNLNPFYIILFVTIIQFCLNQIFNIMIYKLSAKLTIKKFEETVFSTLTTTINVGYILGLLYSSILTDVTGITRKDFSNFGKFIIVTNIVSVFPTIFILITPSSYFEPKIIKEITKNEENKKEFEKKIEIKENDDEEELLM